MQLMTKRNERKMKQIIFHLNGTVKCSTICPKKFKKNFWLLINTKLLHYQRKRKVILFWNIFTKKNKLMESTNVLLMTWTYFFHGIGNFNLIVSHFTECGEMIGLSNCVSITAQIETIVVENFHWIFMASKLGLQFAFGVHNLLGFILIACHQIDYV